MDRRELFLISLVIFVGIVLWIIYDIYSSKKSEDLLKDITLPTIKVVKIDGKVLDELKKREGLNYED